MHPSTSTPLPPQPEEWGVINHPPHYNHSPLEAITVIESWGLGFCLGNCIKYICRAGHKAGNSELEDLQKAQWYLSRRIAQLDQQGIKDLLPPPQSIAASPQSDKAEPSPSTIHERLKPIL